MHYLNSDLDGLYTDFHKGQKHLAHQCLGIPRMIFYSKSLRKSRGSGGKRLLHTVSIPIHPITSHLTYYITVPGRTSHACQFRWRRLVSGTLKYYQGHRRPPVVTTTSSSFASEMAASTIPSHAASAPTTPSTARYPAPVSPATSPQHTQHYGYDRAPYHHRSSFSGGNFSLPSPASSSPQQQLGSPMAMPGTPCTPPPPHTPTFHGANHYGNYSTHPHYFPSTTEDEDEEDNWTAEEDALLMDRKLCFDEVNVLLRGRREPEIWQRMGKLRWGARGGSESSASGESDVGFSPIDSRGTIKLPPVPAGRILRSHSIQRWLQ